MLPVDQFIGFVLMDRYRIVEVIGTGGWGKVYRAKDLTLDMDVAVKIVHPHLVQDNLRVKRFEQEAHVLSKVENEHIIRIIDHGLSPAPFIVMEYYAGIPLDKWLKENGPMPVKMALDVFIQLCNALQAAESMRIVHRDLKPSNILLKVRNDEVYCKILDFGVAKFLDDASPFGKFTSTGEVLGSPQYMSPEHWKGVCDNKSDIYSLGCMMYELLSGKAPFSAQTGMEYMCKHVFEQAKPVVLVNNTAELPAGLQDILDKCMEKSPGNRYQSSRECLEDLKRVKEGNKPSISLFEKIRRKTDRRRLAVAAFVLAASVSASYYWINSSYRNSELSSAIQFSLPQLPESWHGKTMIEWSEAIEADPGNAQLLYERAILHAMRREYGESSRDLTRAIEINPNFAEAYGERALVYTLNTFGAGIDQALADVEKAVALKPDDAHVIYASAYIHACLGYYEKAIEECKKAIALGENSTEIDQINVYGTLSTSNFLLGRHDDAIKAVDAGLKVVPAKYRWLLYRQRAIVHCSQQQFDRALADLDLATRESTCLPRVWSLKAICLLGMGKTSEADEACAQAMKAEMSSSAERLPTAYRGRADFWRMRGELEKSIQDSSQAISLEEGKCVMSFRLRALCKLQQGKYQDALSDMKQVNILFPKSAKTLSLIAMLESKIGKRDKAEKDIERAFTLGTPTPMIFVHRAGIELDKGELDKSLADLNHAINMNPFLKEAYEIRAIVHAKLGKEGEAAADAERAKRLLPEIVTVYP